MRLFVVMLAGGLALAQQTTGVKPAAVAGDVKGEANSKALSRDAQMEIKALALQEEHTKALFERLSAVLAPAVTQELAQYASEALSARKAEFVARTCGEIPVKECEINQQTNMVSRKAAPNDKK